MKHTLLLVVLLLSTTLMPSPAEAQSSASMPAAKQAKIVHPRLGTSMTTSDGSLTLTLVDRRQNYGAERSTYDSDIISPKSVNVHPDGRRLYVNSLEGCRTVVYETPSMRKLKVIDHRFTTADSTLWAPRSPLYEMKHYTTDTRSFRGRPVESAFSHGGRYLWVPYYRRSFDINAQDPSAVAVIDTRADSIVRLLDAGVLPKMIAVAPDGKTLAISHWGDNTVGIYDIASSDPRKWRATDLIAIDRQLHWNLSLTESVDRDNGSGNCLRGTVYTPDSKYLLVGCMGGNGGIAVIDVTSRRYLGKIYGAMPNLRHLIIADGYLYVSVNGAGYVERVPLLSVYTAIGVMRNRSAKISKWEQCKVGSGARTIEASPDSRYIYAVSNFNSALSVVDAKTMTKIGEIAADSFPVGLAVSLDGKYVYVTSQGRKDLIPSGNCVDVYAVTLH